MGAGSTEGGDDGINIQGSRGRARDAGVGGPWGSGSGVPVGGRADGGTTGGDLGLASQNDRAPGGRGHEGRAGMSDDRMGECGASLGRGEDGDYRVSADRAGVTPMPY